MIKYIIAIAVLWFLYRISTKKDEKIVVKKDTKIDFKKIKQTQKKAMDYYYRLLLKLELSF